MSRFDSSADMVKKLVLNQVVLIFFSIVLTAATGRHQTLYLFVSIFCALFYLFLMYTYCWELGAKDKLRIEGGRMAPAPWRCVWLSLIANALNILGALIVLVTKLFLQYVEPLNLWERITAYPMRAELAAEAAEKGLLVGEVLADTTPVWLERMCGFTDAIMRVLQCMYLGIMQAINVNNTLLYFVAIGLTVAVCGVSYLLGTKNINLFGGGQKPQEN